MRSSPEDLSCYMIIHAYSFAVRKLFSPLLMLRFLLPIAIGAALGSLMGYYGQCSSGACPLTSTWWRGAIYGGVLGLLFASSGRA
jgi:hypothetical protein